MIKKTGSLIVMTAVFFLSTCQAHAQLIDWNRRRRALERANKEKKEEMKKELPQWVSTLPMVNNSDERRYDVNRDGYLQLAETKIFLRDVVDDIDGRGGIAVHSDILKEYDDNDDGVISREEAEAIKKHVR